MQYDSFSWPVPGLIIASQVFGQERFVLLVYEWEGTYPSNYGLYLVGSGLSGERLSGLSWHDVQAIVENTHEASRDREHWWTLIRDRVRESGGGAK